MKTVSIIIPTYKRGGVVKKTLPSYLNQKFVKEIIIVDDGGFAFNEIKGIIKRHRVIKYFAPAKRLGLPGGRNFGVAHATGDFIIFGEDDVEFTPDYVAVLMQNMEKEHTDIIGGRQIFVYAGERKNSALARVKQLAAKDLYICYPTDVNFSVDLGRNVTLHTLLPFSLFRREVFNKLRYDENLTGNYHREETDLYISALKAGFKIVFCNEAFVWHLNYLSRAGGCRTQKKLSLEFSLLRNNIYFWKKHYKFLCNHLKLKGPFVYYALKYSVLRYLSYLKKRV
ncbi:MAG: glycosyltransferase family 2 protein [Candidatus Aenigmarchaeota archaeon]|nr:glycosyltransferase family 2 protein [Candidatus Aenigmarchaeota archaeon]